MQISLEYEAGSMCENIPGETELIYINFTLKEKSVGKVIVWSCKV